MRDRRRCNSRKIPPQPPATRAISQWECSLEWRHAVTLNILVGKICISFFLFYCEGMLSLVVLWLCGWIELPRYNRSKSDIRNRIAVMKFSKTATAYHVDAVGVVIIHYPLSCLETMPSLSVYSPHSSGSACLYCTTLNCLLCQWMNSTFNLFIYLRVEGGQAVGRDRGGEQCDGSRSLNLEIPTLIFWVICYQLLNSTPDIAMFPILPSSYEIFI